MCGLVGIVGDLGVKEERVFRHMLLQNSLRGIHGCGIFGQVKEAKGVKGYYWKSLKPSSTYVFSPEFQEITRAGLFKSLLGHSRHATIGEVTKENTHPFNNDTICGMHNGTIRGNFDHKNKFTTDSEALFYNIHEKGLEEALKHIHKTSWGNPAYAIQYYDSKDGSIKVIRNDERPLYYAYNKKENVTVWASEKAFFIGALVREDMRTGFRCHELAPGDLLTVNPKEGEYKPVITRNFFKTPKRTTNVVRYHHGTNGNYGRHGEWSKNYWDQYDNYRNKSELNDDLPFNIIQVGNVFLKPEDFNRRVLNKGCAGCGTQIPLSSANSIKITANQKLSNSPGWEYICEDCIGWMTDTFSLESGDLIVPQTM